MGLPVKLKKPERKKAGFKQYPTIRRLPAIYSRQQEVVFPSRRPNSMS